MFLNQYNGDNKRKENTPDGVSKELSVGDPAKEKRAARRIRRTDQWEHLRKGLFRYKDSARQAGLEATRR